MQNYVIRSKMSNVNNDNANNVIRSTCFKILKHILFENNRVCVKMMIMINMMMDFSCRNSHPCVSSDSRTGSGPVEQT